MGRVREISGCREGLWAFLCEDKACSGRGAVRGAESAAGSSGPLYLRRRRSFSRLLSAFISCTPLVVSPLRNSSDACLFWSGARGLGNVNTFGRLNESGGN